MEFTPEIKKEFLDEIERMKRQLDILANEINEIETGKDLEFLCPIKTAGQIEDDIHIIRNNLKEWRDEGVEYTEFP